jgi:hypothetical protein
MKEQYNGSTVAVNNSTVAVKQQYNSSTTVQQQ